MSGAQLMNKKETIQALEEKWGVKARYLGVPTFAYEIKTETQHLIIDRHGVIRDLQGHELHAEELLSAEPAPTEKVALGIDGYAVEFPMTNHTGASLRNLVNMISSKQQLLISAFDLPHLFMDDLFAEELRHKETDTIEAFQNSFMELGPDRCPGIEIDFEKRTVALKLLKENLSTDEMAAFRDLAMSINSSAQKLKNSSFRPSQEENPKFGLRTWMTRIGINGAEFKTTRKTILSRLDGSSSFRRPKAKGPEVE